MKTIKNAVHERHEWISGTSLTNEKTPPVSSTRSPRNWLFFGITDTSLSIIIIIIGFIGSGWSVSEDQ
jgi:hypothetical protein